MTLAAQRVSLIALGVADLARSRAYYGALARKPAEAAFRGGYSGYRADPDGHVGEMAHNPFGPLAGGGFLILPA